MKLIVKIKNTHFVLFFLSICIFFPISTLNNILKKNNDSKVYVSSVYQAREFTNSNDDENNKKFIFSDNSKEVSNLYKNIKIEKTESEKIQNVNDMKDTKLLQNPVIRKNEVKRKKNHENIFDSFKYFKR